MTADAFTVRTGSWGGNEPALRFVRHAVFIVEQRVPAPLEWDDADAASLHALAVDEEGEPIGCARLLPDGHIGRVAVLASWRRRGVGSALLRCLIDEARRQGHRAVLLNAQADAMPFYARHGFVARGGAFDEAGIPHHAMERSL
ncbi:MAG TPA: GNAT family N-acetyltransferase [Casimicrobiaceae bacterium]|jgi:predicted GNAT family N-acyltransferase|nr:GNAT family N-acetyltransferase [Casimicrobiaceae bacterium]